MSPDQDFQRERQQRALEAMRSRSGIGRQMDYQGGGERMGRRMMPMDSGGGGGMRSMLLRALMGGG